MNIKKHLNRIVTAAAVMLALGANTVSAQYNGYMNVYELDCATPIFDQPWGTDALRATGDASITLQPNTNGYDDNPGDGFWRDNAGAGPGGNKCMQAFYYQETVAPSLAAGTVVELSGWVDSNTLGADHTATAVISLFDGAYNFITSASAPLTAGQAFSVSMDLTARAGENLVIQSGFRTVGPTVPGDSAAAGTGVALRVGANTALGAGNSSAEDDPTGIPVLPLWGLLGLAGLIGFMGYRRKQA